MRTGWSNLTHAILAGSPGAFLESRLLWFFSIQILDEVEKRHQISMAIIYPFMQGLREATFPAPGKTVTLKSFIPDSGTEVGEQNRGDPPWVEGAGSSSTSHHSVPIYQLNIPRT